MTQGSQMELVRATHVVRQPTRHGGEAHLLHTTDGPLRLGAPVCTAEALTAALDAHL